MLSFFRVGICKTLCCGMLLLSLGLQPSRAANGFWSAPSAIDLSPAIKTFLHHVQANAADFKVRDVLGPSGQPIPVAIEVNESLGDDPNGRLFIFSGIPGDVRLDPGGNFGQFWAVNSNALGELTLLAPEGYSGSFTVKVTQTGTSPDDPKRSAAFTVTITAPDTPKNQKPTAVIASVDTTPTSAKSASDAAPQNDSPRKQPAPTVPNLRDEKLMERAATLLSNGDISGARTVFQYLAARGNAQAAIALAGTYDPVILAPLFIKGLTPDPEKAEIWYKKAEELGSPAAQGRLDALARR
jgi:hypothetical protein